MGMASDLMTVLTLVNEARASERCCGDVAYQAVPPLSLDAPAVVAAAWLESPGHCINAMKPDVSPKLNRV